MRLKGADEWQLGFVQKKEGAGAEGYGAAGLWSSVGGYLEFNLD